MIIRKMTLENFRQFKNVQTIDFNSNNNSTNNVVVVFGENGRGKTGLFRAIIFCLFGERKLSQDGDTSKDEIQLVNVSAIDNNPGQPVTTSVEVEFQHKECIFKLKRTILGMRDDKKIIEELKEVRLYITYPDGNTKTVPTNEIDQKINDVLDKRVKDYFLFDGEKIEKLTRTDSDQRREIGIGIRNLLNVNDLETAIKAFEKVTKKLEKELSNTSSVELAQYIKQLNDIEDELSKENLNIDNLEKELSFARQEIKKIDIELDKFNDLKPFLEKRKNLENRLIELKQKLNDSLLDMKTSVNKAAILMCTKTINSVFMNIDGQKQKGQIPSEIRVDLIEKIIETKKCICGNEICENTEAYDNIIKWLKRTADTKTQDVALDLWRHLSELISHFEGDSELIEKKIQLFGNAKSDFSNIEHEINQVSNQIGAAERLDASKLDSSRLNVQENIINYESDYKNKKSNIEHLLQEKDRLSTKVKEEKLKEGMNNELSKRSILSRDTKDALSKVYSEFTNEIKDIISISATGIFHKLLDEEGKTTLKKIIVNNDYSLQVLDRYGKPFLANISAGQRQIMSIAFIMALALQASHENFIDIPIFMDTPFGRLSFEHRKNIIKQIPEMTNQWIILATDTEFRKQEAKLLLNSGKWKKFFMLKTLKDGNTKVEEINIESAMIHFKEEVI